MFMKLNHLMYMEGRKIGQSFNSIFSKQILFMFGQLTKITQTTRNSERIELNKGMVDLVQHNRRIAALINSICRGTPPTHTISLLLVWNIIGGGWKCWHDCSSGKSRYDEHELTTNCFISSEYGKNREFQRFI